MAEEFKTTDESRRSAGSLIHDGMFAVLIAVFVALYAAAFAGKLDPLKDNTILMRLEPVIFILVGYIIARIPSRTAEKRLSAELARQTRRADAAQFAKEAAVQEREVVEERLSNARIAILRSKDGNSEAAEAILNS
jgi:ABC-type transport system involved in cytochrome bd biosynthesis fused ATPase/permease subunit